MNSKFIHCWETTQTTAFSGSNLRIIQFDFSLCLWVDFQVPKPGGVVPAPPVSRDGSGSFRSSSISSDGSGGRILSLLSMSDNVHGGLSCFLPEQALEHEERRQRICQLAEIQRLKEVRAAAQLKNLEDFLKMNHVSLKDTVSYTTGMYYR